MHHFAIEAVLPEGDYELLDSGDGEKLERFGAVTLVRPDPQVLWHKQLPPVAWESADGTFVRSGTSGSWKLGMHVPKKWTIAFGGLNLVIRPTSFKHTGLFPEQKPNWEWMSSLITKAGRPISVLNLFGYTGGASLAAAKAGASVTHVDGSKVALTWARENAEASGLATSPIRWIPDDAREFVERELKRGKRYDGIIMDPPTFGRGPKGEVWKLEDDLRPLLENCRKILTDTPLFILVNGYASGYSAIAYQNAVDEMMRGVSGKSSIGELAIEEAKTGRLLPAGIFTRWETA